MHRHWLARFILLLVLLWPTALLADDFRDITVEGKAPADYVQSDLGQSWAVVIGIDDYEKVRRLTYAVEDAKAVAEMLEQRGFKVATLYDKQATRRAILRELGDKLLEKVGEHDRVVVFFAGHGETRKLKGGKQLGYLLPVQGQQDGLSETGIDMGAIRNLADALPAKHVLFLMDVCYGGVAGQQFRDLPSVSEAYLKQITRERGRQLITAGGADQRAMEGPEWGHSVFTYYVLEGISKGLADLNHDGIIPVSELYSYLDSRVFAAAQLRGHEQRPELWAMAAEKGEFVFLTKGLPGTPANVASVADDVEQERQRLAKERRQPEADRDRLAEERRKLAEDERRAAETSGAGVQTAKAPAYETPRTLKSEITGKDSTPMRLIPAGPFTMGFNEESADERPAHTVHLDAFYMDAYEVTINKYLQFMQATKREPPGFWHEDVIFKYDQRPVIGVSWQDADAYCRWTGKRLPTEAEWEKAARGTDARKYPWGNERPTSRYANFDRCCGWKGYGPLLQVGSLETGKSPYGIYDLAGNAWEWTADWYDERYYRDSPERNPKGPASGKEKVIRGGSWISGPLRVRTSDRLFGVPTLRLDDVGFRCVMDAPK